MRISACRSFEATEEHVRVINKDWPERNVDWKHRNNALANIWKAELCRIWWLSLSSHSCCIASDNDVKNSADVGVQAVLGPWLMMSTGKLMETYDEQFKFSEKDVNTMNFEWWNLEICTVLWTRNVVMNYSREENKADDKQNRVVYWLISKLPCITIFRQIIKSSIDLANS